MRATREWILPTFHVCPDCGAKNPTRHCGCEPLPSQLTIEGDDNE